MKLIERVEVAYFRSIYKESISDLEGMTIFFGRNDSGKSNFLRALNLFFEGHTNPELAFNFDRDFNHCRAEEASASQGARKFVYIKVHFIAPSNWRNSLGETFWVKKQWSVHKQIEPGFETSVELNKQHYLTRFLNKVKFHYVPAIKDRTIFERLLGKVYSVLSSQQEFNDSLDSFSGELRNKTAQLSDSILGTLGIASTIAPPTDLTELFRSLDFETTSEHGDSYSLTLQRGDGVQVRHIPQILAFLSDRGPEDYHVWGFEEPENSLELAAAIDEANRFFDFSKSLNKQIFVTSHSPAFFRLENDGINKYFVSKQSPEGYSKPVSTLREIAGIDAASLPADLMGETPHLAVISSYLDEASRKIQHLEAESKALVKNAQETTYPLLFVEGVTDAKILEAAWKAFVGYEHPLRLVDCAGTTKMQSLEANGTVLRALAPARRLYVLVDNDGEGRNLRKESRLAKRGGKWIVHNSNKTWWSRLWLPDEFVREMESLNIPHNAWPGTLENIFPRNTRMRALNEGAYELGESPFTDLLTPELYPRISARLNSNDPQKMYIFAPTPESKSLFADWLVAQAEEEPDILLPLRQTVIDLYGLMAAET